MKARATPIAIRRILPGEAAAFARIAERLFRESFSLANDLQQIDAYCAAHFTPAVLRAELCEPTRDCYFAIEGHWPVVGYAQLRTGTRPKADVVDVGSAPAELERCYVDHTYHGRGVAQQLMHTCIEQARRRGAATVWLGVWQENPRAIAFYQKCGFEIVGEQIFMLGSEAQNDYIMAKVIA